ncbi:MAG: LPS assembly protein LptD [Ignavibacteria bacterium]|nr:LPS assembly protein LptD [Ignavibacteria bacterium]
MKIKLIFALLSLVFLTSSFAQTFNGRISSSVYGFERAEAQGVENQYLRSFQMVNLNLNQNNVSLRTAFNFEKDLLKKFDYDPRVRVYNLYFEARNLFDFATLKIGRQPLFHSVASGIFDGAALELKYENFKLSTYYGGNVPAYQKLKMTDKFSEDYLFGLKFATSAIENLHFALGYINKNFKQEEYSAVRLDDLFNADTLLIKRGASQFKLLSAELGYEFTDNLSVDTRLDYDLNYKKPTKIEATASFNPMKNMGLNLYYNMREPLIRYNSYFTIFEAAVENSQEVEAGVDYRFNSFLTAIGKFGYVTYKDENSTRITAGLIIPFGTITYRKSLGYAGEIDNVSLYSAYPLFCGLVTPSLGLSYSGYKLSASDEKNNVLSLLAGFNYRPWRILSFDLQGQYMNNKIYKNDYRLFFKINYWFNTNLGLM